jgi:hypothetical protein
LTSEPALAFFVDYLESEGAAVETGGEVTLAVLPEALQRRHGLSEELVLSADPDVAAEYEALLCIPGQPVLLAAADEVLARGDVGWSHLPWPAAPPPSRERLEQVARDDLAVEHGRIDLTGQPAPRWLPLLWCGALVSYNAGLEERVEEKAEVLVDAHGRGRLPGTAAIVPDRAHPGRGSGHEHVPPHLVTAARLAHGRLVEAAALRRTTLSRGAARARGAELERVERYYASVLASIAKRRHAAPEERRALYDAQSEATEAERARRVAEVEEKFAGASDIRPYRLRVIEVPALAVPATVRRGARSFALSLLYCVPLARYVVPTCPHCGSDEPLVAGKDRLGCRACLLRPVEADGSAAMTGGGAGPPPRLAGAPSPPGGTPGAAHGAPGRAELDAGAARTGARRDADREEKRAGARLRRIEKIWKSNATEFWRHVANDERAPEIAAHSPIAALYRWYGTRGPLIAIGLSEHSVLTSLTAEAPDEDEEGVLSTSGSLRAHGGSRAFTLRWRLVGTRPAMVEVLPYRVVQGALLPSRELVGASARSLLYERAPVPRGLGPVGAALLARVAEEGLPLVVRALALHGKVEGGRRLADVPPERLAAALLLEARRHSMGRAPNVADLATLGGCSASELRHLAERVGELSGFRSAPLW